MPVCLSVDVSFDVLVHSCILTGELFQDEDFVLDKDDEGSPTDDSGEGESDAIDSIDEKEVRHLLHIICIIF